MHLHCISLLVFDLLVVQCLSLRRQFYVFDLNLLLLGHPRTKRFHKNRIWVSLRPAWRQCRTGTSGPARESEFSSEGHLQCCNGWCLPSCKVLHLFPSSRGLNYLTTSASTYLFCLLTDLLFGSRSGQEYVFQRFPAESILK